MIKLTIADAFTSEALGEILSHLNCQIVRCKELRPTSEELAGSQGLLLRSRTRVDRQLLDQARDLRLIVTATSGFDHIDIAECSKRNITVCHTPDANASSAAELTIGFLLRIARHLPSAEQTVREHRWRGDELRGRTLSGQTLGVIGLGRVGRKVAQVARAMGMNLIGYDPYIENKIFSDLTCERLGLTEVLIAADFITLHVPLTRETHHLLGRSTLRLTNPDAWIINTSRGSVIDEYELAMALDEHLIAGAALDVFSREPLPPDSALRGRPNVLLTPHVGGFTEEALAAASLGAAQIAIDFFSKQQIHWAIPKDAPWFNQLLNET
jgi:D-3-phosphoglycerate dehydrogenase / 2-oxoglutarate reductase